MSTTLYGPNIQKVWEAIYASEDMALHAAMYAWTAARMSAGRVLDVGCEHGFGTSLITGSNPRLAVVGVDLDLAALGGAYHMESRVNAEGGHLPVASFSITGLYLINVLNLVQDPTALLAEARRTLKPGGMVVIGLTREGCAVAPERTGHWIQWLLGRLEQSFEAIVIPAAIQGRFASHPMSTFPLNSRAAPWLAIATK